MSAQELLARLVAHYEAYTRYREVDDYGCGMAALLIESAMHVYGIDEDAATERVGDMVTDIRCDQD